ncbi:hypothetical protein ACMSW1_001667 [Cronobacter dublinensis]
MSFWCLNSRFENINSFNPTNSDFLDIGGACSERYIMALENCFYSHDLNLDLAIVVNKLKKPIAYCSYLYWTTPDYSDQNLNMLNYQLDYIFVRDEYRGKGISSIILDKIVIPELYFYKKSNATSKDVFDNSEYISDEGWYLGCKVKQKLLSVR